MENEHPEASNVESWKRRQVKGTIEVSLEDDSIQYFDLPMDDLPLRIKLNIRNKRLNNLRLVTVTLINASKLSDESKIEGNSKSIFQTHLSVRKCKDTNFMGLPDERLPKIGRAHV